MKQIPTSDNLEEWSEYFRAELKEVSDGFQALGTRVKEDMRQDWIKRACPSDVALMLSQRSFAEMAVSSSKPTVREVALQVLVNHWGPDNMLAAKSEELAVSDPEESVRSCALYCLGQCYRDSYDPRISQFLAKIVRDNTQSTRIRFAAYAALFPVHGVPPHDWPLSIEKLIRGEGFAFPEQVDWAFVESCLSGSGLKDLEKG